MKRKNIAQFIDKYGKVKVNKRTVSMSHTTWEAIQAVLEKVTIK